MTSRLQARLLAHRSLFQQLNQRNKRNKLQAGFTLIELLIVVVILGILSAIGIPALINQQKKAVASANNTSAMSAARACAAAIAGGSSGDYEAVTGVTPTTCALSTDFTADADTTKATPGVATVTALGGVSLKTSSAPK